MNLKLDPRTKIVLLIVCNLIFINIKTDGIALLVKPLLFFTLLLLFMGNEKNKIVRISFVIISIAWLVEIFGITKDIHGLLGFLIDILINIIIEMYPCFLAGYYLIMTTNVSELLQGLRKLKIPEFLVIPIAIVFRFFPTVYEENIQIKQAMAIRSVSLKNQNVLKIFEYRVIPLMLSVVNIGDDLTASALTKGLGYSKIRTSIYELEFKIMDILFILYLILLVILFFWRA